MCLCSQPGRYDSRNSVLEWSIVLIDNSNRRYVVFENHPSPLHFVTQFQLRAYVHHYLFPLFDSGSMEFVVPPADSSVFFPISVQFSAASTFSYLKVYSSSTPLSE